MSDCIYLERFILPTPEREERLIEKRMRDNDPSFGYIENYYPARMFPDKGLRELNFDKITILYGGNGSGKSTILNLIATKLRLERISPYNGSELFPIYADACKYQCGISDEGFDLRIPNGSRIITSDDVFDYMLAVRSNNDEITEITEEAKGDYARLKASKNTIHFKGMDDYEDLRLQVLARRKSVSRRQFIKKTVGQEVDLHSNGETALEYFDSHLKDRTLYCLDEPENSLSPKLQLELKEILEDLARCDTQLIIATHSPFILALKGARIYNLDESPVDIRPWWELENTRTYFDFFNNNRDLFL